MCPYYDKLEQILAESEQYQLNILGPDVPTTSSSPPQQDVVHLVQEEQEVRDRTPTHSLQHNI